MSDRYRCGMLFGAPGVGKGTQGQRLGEVAGFVHLATGDIFRGLDKESEPGRKFVEYSSRGELVPDDLTVTVWRDHVQSLIDAGTYTPATDLLLLDGMPRSVNQAQMLDALIEPLVILHLVAHDLDEMVNRMKLRAEKEGRHDDADETVIRRRFEVYQDETAPVLEHYDAGLVRDINAVGKPARVLRDILSAVAPLHDDRFENPLD